MLKCVKIDFSAAIPIFPLPNCVLLPRAILPLHIFEPRYREMVNDALKGSPVIAMAVLEPGYEEKYYTHVARIRELLCVGVMVRHEKLEDGRYNVLIQGTTRARVLRETRDKPYRLGWLSAVSNEPAPDEELDESIRRRLIRALDAPALSEVARQADWFTLVRSRDMPAGDVVDYLASAVNCTVECGVRFLNELDVSRRADMLLEALKEFACRLSATAPKRTSCEQRSWPRGLGAN